jgi:hypothetical protein
VLELIENQPFLMSTIRTSLENPEHAHISAQPDGVPQSHPPGAKKQPPIKWKWEKNLENERIREMCLVEKIINTTPTQE